jgi:hypothetical protein
MSLLIFSITPPAGERKERSYKCRVGADVGVNADVGADVSAGVGVDVGAGALACCPYIDGFPGTCIVRIDKCPEIGRTWGDGLCRL